MVETSPQGETSNRTGSIIPPETPGRAEQVVDLNEMSEADQALAAKFGYKPVLKREFGYLSTFSFAVSIGGLFSTVTTTLIYPLQAGGSASAVWCMYSPSLDTHHRNHRMLRNYLQGWLISGAGCMCIAVRVLHMPKSFRH